MHVNTSHVDTWIVVWYEDARCVNNSSGGLIILNSRARLFNVLSWRTLDSARYLQSNPEYLRCTAPRNSPRRRMHNSGNARMSIRNAQLCIHLAATLRCIIVILTPHFAPPISFSWPIAMNVSRETERERENSAAGSKARALHEEELANQSQVSLSRLRYCSHGCICKSIERG